MSTSEVPDTYVPPTGMCPHCGEIVRLSEGDWLTATHDWPKPTRQVCPGSQQNPRNPESDGRPLWNGEANPHYYRNKARAASHDDRGER